MGVSTELLEKLDKYFSESEMKELCFEMSIEYENIEGTGKRSRMLEFIRYVKRHERLDEFVQLCQQKRPSVSFALPPIGQEEATPTETTSKKLFVFISHASQDKPLVRQLCNRLSANGFDPWLDEERILPGHDWDLEIKQAMRASDVILLCFSRASVAKEGYIQREYKKAMEYQQEKPEGAIFVIPVRLDDCEIPFSIQGLQYVDYPGGFTRLVMSLNLRAQKLNHPIGTPPTPTPAPKDSSLLADGDEIVA